MGFQNSCRDLLLIFSIAFGKQTSFGNDRHITPTIATLPGEPREPFAVRMGCPFSVLFFRRLVQSEPHSIATSSVSGGNLRIYSLMYVVFFTVHIF